MVDHDKNTLLDKIWGCWTGKISGGMYGSRVEGRTKKFIQKMVPPLTGWIETHRQQINDDEQYELIALLALESLDDAMIKAGKTKHEILSPELLGRFWKENLDRRYVFTAEKAALENAVDHGVPWEHAADEIYENRYQNAYFDWIGAQMKGELFGMLAPASGWHSDQSPTAENDLKRLRLCVQLSLEDAWIAHRGVGIAGELFVSAMVAVGIDFNPIDVKTTITYPAAVKFLARSPLPDRPSKWETIEQHGVTAEILKSDIVRVKDALLLLDDKRISKPNIAKFYECIDAVVATFELNHDPRFWEQAWAAAEEASEKYRRELVDDARQRLSNNKAWLKERLNLLKKDRAFGVHTVPNNAAIVIGLIYGDGDMFQTMHRATECGLDTDCNAGNAAAILGAYLGNKLIPSYEKRFARGEILSPLANWKEMSLQKLAERTFAQAERLMDK
nr:ADP-ribosylglycohydrolase family protein [Candidatus Sigynarchaeota archaeon]